MLINAFLTLVPTYATSCNWFVCVFSRKSWYREVQGSFLSPFHDHFVIYIYIYIYTYIYIVNTITATINITTTITSTTINITTTVEGKKSGKRT